jgi:hypothetical protein
MGIGDSIPLLVSSYLLPGAIVVWAGWAVYHLGAGSAPRPRVVIKRRPATRPRRPF